jgi:hypothetical protein
MSVENHNDILAYLTVVDELYDGQSHEVSKQTSSSMLLLGCCRNSGL